jgi:two-component system, NtrC family, nitrogen regulation response regulator GlnG
MTEEDTTATTLGTLVTMAESSRLPILPALTILAHPDVNRVGEMAPLTSLFDRRPAKVDRDEPLFFRSGSDKGRGLEHRGVSKKTTSIVIAPLPDSPARFELRPGDTTHSVELDLKPFGEPRPVTSEELTAGLVITINKRVVVCLHRAHYPVSRSRDLGLLGASDEIEAVRRKILRAAAHPDTPVLIRGETGVGKEPAARAIHAESKRAARPFIVLNMARLTGALADADLFGHARGAFTDAKGSRAGAFLQADGGTLFLDEIGEATPEVQAKLLRALEETAVVPVGGDQARPVDVRVVAATDKNLEDEVRLGRFDNALYFRLNVYPIDIPPLRARRADVGVLFFAALKQRLQQTGALARLDDDPNHPSWIPARTVARLAVAPWPGNVRELFDVVERLVVESSDHHDLDVDDFISRELARSARLGSVATPDGSPPALATPPAVDAPKRAKITLPQLLEALTRAHWNKSEAARAFGMSRPTFYRLIEENHPAVHQVLEIAYDDIVRQYADCGGNVQVLAKKLGIPPDVLLSRLRPAGG